MISIITYIDSYVYNSYNRNYTRIIYIGKSKSKLHLVNYCIENKFLRGV